MDYCAPFLRKVGGQRYIRAVGRRFASVALMTTFYDVPADLLIPAIATKLADRDGIQRPDWANYVKTGVHRERPPTQDNWWELRAAAVLRKVARAGPIGVNHLAQEYGGPKNRGSAPNKAATGSRHIVRTVLQQLSDEGLVQIQTTVAGLKLGRVVTPDGHRMLDEAAQEVRPQAEKSYPGLARY